MIWRQVTTLARGYDGGLHPSGTVATTTAGEQLLGRENDGAAGPQELIRSISECEIDAPSTWRVAAQMITRMDGPVDVLHADAAGGGAIGGGAAVENTQERSDVIEALERRERVEVRRIPYMAPSLYGTFLIRHLPYTAGAAC